MECVSALHHNKRKTNYHIHLIFSERELLPEPIEKIATRNMFYNEQKKHVRTKKEILDDSGNVRKGCKIIKKGEIYERTLFTAKNKLFHETLEKEYGSKTVIQAEDTADVVTTPTTEEITQPEPPVSTITATVLETKVVEQSEPQIPPRPVMPPEASAFPRLQKIKVTLDKQNHLIFEAERERNKPEIELSDLKGLARLTKKKELESRIATKTEEIRNLKAGLSGIIRQHGFATVQDFYTAFYTAQRAIDAYLKECAKWEEAYGEKATPKAETMHEKIQRYKEKVDRHNANQPYRSRDKGAR